jgi:hypothetical protein
VTSTRRALLTIYPINKPTTYHATLAMTTSAVKKTGSKTVHFILDKISGWRAAFMERVPSASRFAEWCRATGIGDAAYSVQSAA